ncbi:zinc finger protein 830 [Chelonus insularis]|uniref:zinc finger protein 830 n=1 Tax=Chelonus insularis TaxID=460826 RepID=UPI00158E66F9|nr:zinc finger protein 830 [Chelonus insularis]
MSSKKLTQQDLRKAMYDHKKKAGLVKRIESPLAKYTEAGQLMCIICKTIIRSEAIWVVHLNSKTHKENIEITKKKLDDKVNNKLNSSSNKRSPSPTKENVPNKKIKGILKNPGHIKTSTSSALPSDFFDQASLNGKPAIASVPKTTEKSSADKNNELSNESTVMEIEQVQEAEANSSAALPEGFFDDPVLDARVRNVEYKDPIEEEWDRYLKEIKDETDHSAQLIAEDHEEATNERQLNEIDEQLSNWSRVINLLKKKEQFRIKPKQVATRKDDSTDDESEYDEFLDWRVKNSYK